MWLVTYSEPDCEAANQTLQLDPADDNAVTWLRDMLLRVLVK